MQSVIDYLKIWQPHPFVDHFTVALILLGIVADLVGSIFSARLWLRYMALSLMIVGAIGAAASNVTGGWEAHRVWESVSGPGKAVLERHAWWGDVLPWVFAGLALWRLGSQFIGFLAATRPIYLLVAIVGGVLIVYQGHLGGVMVYDFGIGTALLAGSQTNAPSPIPSPERPAPEETSTPAAPASSTPVPSPIPSNLVTSTPTATGSAVATPTITPSISAAPSTTTPSAAPSSSGVVPPPNPPSESASPTGGTAKNL